MRRSERLALFALGFLTAATAAWWALALWPTTGAAPEWLARARVLCFNSDSNGLPDASGWLLLIGQPIGMLAALLLVCGRELKGALAALALRWWGRAMLGACVAALSLGAVAAAERVGSASSGPELDLRADAALPATYPRLDRAAPALSLLDQHGRRIDLEDLRGRPALVTFVFGNCHSVCPAVVHEILAARETLGARVQRGGLPSDRMPRVVVVTLDPWRDTPARLPHLAEHWKLSGDDHVLSGSVQEVEAVLSDWKVARQRDPKTGDIVHPPLIYVLDGTGRIAFASTGGTSALAELVGRL